MSKPTPPDVVDKAFAEIRTAYDRLRRLSETNVLQPKTLLKPKEFPPQVNGNTWRVGHSWMQRDANTIKELDARVAEFDATYQAWLAEANGLVEANKELIEHNKLVRQRVSEYMRAVGVPDAHSERDLTSRSKNPKFITKSAGYLTDIVAIAPTCCPVAVLISNAKTQRATLQQQYDRRVEAIRQAEREAEEKKRKETSYRELVAAQIRYNLDADSTWHDVLEEVLDKNVVLSLADAMLSCRNDWSDGCDGVEHALAAAEGELTKDQIESISRAVENFHEDQDGRYFRDCESSYDDLFAQISTTHPELYNDYKIAKERIDVY